MEALTKRVDEIDARLRVVEQNNSSITATLSHFTLAVDNFINTLKSHEEKEDIRFEKFEKELSKLSKFAYIAIGGIMLFQLLVSVGVLSFGAK